MRKIKRLYIPVVTAFALMVSQAHAEILSVDVFIDGLSCPFCAYGVEKKLTKLDGVSGIDISLKAGKAVLMMDKGKTPDIAKVKIAVKEAGFTPREIRITVAGTPVMEATGAVLHTINPETRYALLEKGDGDPDSFSNETRKIITDLAERKAPAVVTGTVRKLPDGPALEIIDIKEKK